MNMGIIEPYSSGFLEILPEGESSDYWLIAGIHINGEVFCPSPRLYRSERVALARAAQLYDWIADNKPQISAGDFYCSPLNVSLWYQPKLS
ncbi:hypothetical protein LC593_26940 [Nostoc sp. CHAB 5844]|nr:hypothetical protein [Nostoc sp. CHAB 5844]